MRRFILPLLSFWAAACDPDADGDGVPASEDCEDDNAEIYPDQAEACDGIDNNCDGTADEGTLLTFYADVDGDGFGDPTKPFERCEVETGLVADNTDCDDAQAKAKPGGIEVCDEIDNDCDEQVDEEATDAPVWYRDQDGDKFGDDNTTVTVCDPGDGYVDVGGDCNDVNELVNPGEDEVCNGIDDDCKDGIDGPDALDARTWYQDRDADTYGDPETVLVSCTEPDGYVDDNADCNDFDAAEKPGAKWYPDADKDGFGAKVAPFECGKVNGTDVANDRDCDDTKKEISPGAREIWYDGIDQDCNGSSDFDQDNDTYDSAEHEGDDCDDTDPSVNPGASEKRNGGDDNCDGMCDEGLITAGELVITEFMNDPSKVADDKGEWVEIYNPGRTDIVICEGWSLKDAGTDDHAIVGPITVKAGGHVVFANNSDPTTNGGVTVDYKYASYFLANADDEIILEFDGTLIDEVWYDEKKDNWAFIDVGGVSKQVDYDYRDSASNDDSYSWCNLYSSMLSAGDYGSPGSDNDYCYVES